MDKSCILSVIIPCYNAEKTISSTIKSIYKELSNNISYEFILVNDGSLDHTEDIIIDLISQKNYNIKYYKKENGGVSDARNYGLKKAGGNYIWFFDADDLLFDNVGRIVCNILISNKPDILRFNSYTVDYTNIDKIDRFNNCESARIKFNGFYSDYLMDNYIGASCYQHIYKASLLNNNGNYFLLDNNLTACEDTYYNLKLAQTYPKCNYIYLDLKVIKYVVNSNSLINTSSSLVNKKMMISYIKFQEYLDLLYCDENFYLKKSLEQWRLRNINQIITRFLSCDLSYKETNYYIKIIKSLIKPYHKNSNRVKLFILISKSYIITKFMQFLYRIFFLKYVKPYIARN